MEPASATRFKVPTKAQDDSTRTHISNSKHRSLPTELAHSSLSQQNLRLSSKKISGKKIGKSGTNFNINGSKHQSGETSESFLVTSKNERSYAQIHKIAFETSLIHISVLEKNLKLYLSEFFKTKLDRQSYENDLRDVLEYDSHSYVENNVSSKYFSTRVPHGSYFSSLPSEAEEFHDILQSLGILLKPLRSQIIHLHKKIVEFLKDKKHTTKWIENLQQTLKAMLLEKDIEKFISRYEKSPSSLTDFLDELIWGGKEQRKLGFFHLRELNGTLGLRMAKCYLFFAIGQKLESQHIPYLSYAPEPSTSNHHNMDRKETVNSFLNSEVNSSKEVIRPQSIKITSKGSELTTKVKRHYKGSKSERSREFFKSLFLEIYKHGFKSEEELLASLPDNLKVERSKEECILLARDLLSCINVSNFFSNKPFGFNFVLNIWSNEGWKAGESAFTAFCRQGLNLLRSLPLYTQLSDGCCMEAALSGPGIGNIVITTVKNYSVYEKKDPYNDGPVAINLDKQLATFVLAFSRQVNKVEESTRLRGVLEFRRVVFGTKESVIEKQQNDLKKFSWQEYEQVIDALAVMYFKSQEPNNKSYRLYLKLIGPITHGTIEFIELKALKELATHVSYPEDKVG
jgi:hypothetical protein